MQTFRPPPGARVVKHVETAATSFFSRSFRAVSGVAVEEPTELFRGYPHSLTTTPPS
jgi:hypothetical protein